MSDQPFLCNGAPGTWNSCESDTRESSRTRTNRKTRLFYQGRTTIERPTKTSGESSGTGIFHGLRRAVPVGRTGTT